MLEDPLVLVTTVIPNVLIGIGIVYFFIQGNGDRFKWWRYFVYCSIPAVVFAIFVVLTNDPTDPFGYAGFVLVFFVNVINYIFSVVIATVLIKRKKLPNL